jgi:hypothetical protein
MNQPLRGHRKGLRSWQWLEANETTERSNDNLNASEVDTPGDAGRAPQGPRSGDYCFVLQVEIPKGT